jgi:hypothetical protein
VLDNVEDLSIVEEFLPPGYYANVRTRGVGKAVSASS